jgi:hypothetical protein
MSRGMVLSRTLSTVFFCVFAVKNPFFAKDIKLILIPILEDEEKQNLLLSPRYSHYKMFFFLFKKYTRLILIPL